ncbi:MAG: type II secretion system F family protein [Planctomycetes bacterium]|nr:type II secretion system F family protein [Planctomycetota bacterium]
MKFKYKGVGRDNEPVSGTVTAESREQAMRLLQDQGIRLTEFRGSRRFLPNIMGNKKVSSNDLASFCEQLAGLTESEKPLPGALRGLAYDATKPRMRRALHDVAKRLDEGVSVGDALEREKGVFPSLLVSLVRAGDETGNLPETLRLAAKYLRCVGTIKSEITAAIAYPGMVVLLMFVVGSIVFLFLIPQFGVMFEEFGLELPVWTRVELFIAEHYPWFAAGFLACFWGVFSLFKYVNNPRWWFVFKRWLLFHIPVIGRALHSAYLARFSRLMSTLLISGAPVHDTLCVALEREGGIFSLRSGERLVSAVQDGRKLSEVLRTRADMFPEILIWMVESCEETERLPEAFAEAADVFEHEVARNTELMASILPGVFVVLAGALIGGTVTTLFQPLIGIMSSLS